MLFILAFICAASSGLFFGISLKQAFHHQWMDAVGLFAAAVTLLVISGYLFEAAGYAYALV